LGRGTRRRDGVINLSGEPLADKKWTHTQRRRLVKSRVDATQSLVQACAKSKQKPKFLINASAIGYYGARDDEEITETEPPGEDFLGQLCRDWEEEAKKAEALGIRVVRLRTGIVLGHGGGALTKMVEPFKFFLGGPIGSGKQWMSWIHMEDEVRLILHVIENQQASGAINATCAHSSAQQRVLPSAWTSAATGPAGCRYRIRPSTGSGSTSRTCCSPVNGSFPRQHRSWASSSTSRIYPKPCKPACRCKPR
jgi:uncharacterized protein (TIGR01777 family)